MTERRKNQSEEWTYFNRLFIYFITVNKYRFCISVIGYINMQIIGINIAYKNQYRSITTECSARFCMNGAVLFTLASVRGACGDFSIFRLNEDINT